jgi:hypothetical protein
MDHAAAVLDPFSRIAREHVMARATTTSDYGWIRFASFVLFFAGVMRIFDAIWAFGYNGPLPQSLKHALLGDSLQTYAWLFLACGIVLIAAGIGVLYLSELGRWVGVGAAVIGGLSAMTWMPYYPEWSLLYIGLAIMVMYALIVHGRSPRLTLGT